MGVTSPVVGSRMSIMLLLVVLGLMVTGYVVLIKVLL